MQDPSVFSFLFIVCYIPSSLSIVPCASSSTSVDCCLGPIILPVLFDGIILFMYCSMASYSSCIVRWHHTLHVLFDGIIFFMYCSMA